MILDEPTAALDPIAETQLYRNFASLTEDKTTILISHRLGIASIVDRILVFKDGNIVEDGSHKELMEINGHYAQMYNAQAQWYA
jgi:ABC-type multidrug transport system fused ATPase/permease subunit